MVRMMTVEYEVMHGAIITSRRIFNLTEILATINLEQLVNIKIRFHWPIFQCQPS